MFIVVRHGERLDHKSGTEEFTKRGKWNYIEDTPLSYLGMEQAVKTGQYIKEHLPGAITEIKVVSSPFTRCI